MPDLPLRPAASNRVRVLRRGRAFVVALLAGVAPPAHAALPTGFQDQIVIGGLTSGVTLAFVPDGRALVSEYHVPQIRCVRGTTFAPGDPAVAFYDIRTNSWEKGLLGLAIDPAWPARPYLYILCNDQTTPTMRISRYTGSGDLSGTSDGRLNFVLATRYDVLTGIPDSLEQHKGGTLRFGPDGMLYASIGDDDVPCAAQDSTVLRGKILRLDVSRLPDGAGGPPAIGTIVPPGNPFASSSNPAARLVWADGLRNPFRFAIDAADGAVMVADVGDAGWEEVDRINGGANAGWPQWEGPAPYGGACAAGGAQGPVWSYAHVSGQAAAIIGGPVYRPGPFASHPFPALYRGDYFCSDFYSGKVYRLHWNGTQWTPAAVPGQPDPSAWGTGYPEVTDWLVAPDGALWYCRMSVNNISSQSYLGRIVYTGTAGTPGAGAAPALRLARPVPQPARGAMSLEWAMPAPGPVQLSVLDVQGRQRRRLASGTYAPGVHRLTWDTRDDAGVALAPGVYLVRLDAGGRTCVARAVIAR